MDGCFTIKASSEGKVDSFGTGFLFNDKIITNSHIISYIELGEKFVYENVYAQKNDKIFELSIINNVIEKDYAILKFTNENDVYSFSSLKISFDYSTFLGEPIFTIGNLNNYGLALNFGHISSKEKTIEKSGYTNIYIQTDIEISPGSSGGPVFNSINFVIGIMTLKMREDNGEYIDGASFYIPINTLKNSLE